MSRENNSNLRLIKHLQSRLEGLAPAFMGQMVVEGAIDIYNPALDDSSSTLATGLEGPDKERITN
jgi:hypothetical protein